VFNQTSATVSTNVGKTSPRPAEDVPKINTAQKFIVIKDPGATPSQPATSSVSNIMEEFMHSTNGEFLASEALSVIDICHGQLAMAKAMYDGSSAEEVRQLLMKWLATSPGKVSTLGRVPPSDDGNSKGPATKDDKTGKEDGCGYCSGCDTCFPTEESEDVIMECSHCDSIFRISSVDRCTV
jgi:hypothetical protein